MIPGRMWRKDSAKYSNDMKKLLLTTGLLLCLAFASHAQDGLLTNQIFRGAVEGKEISDTRISGRQLRPFKLTLYRHRKGFVSEENLLRMADWILKDAEKAADRETEFQNGKLIYALVRFEDARVGNKYICFQVKSRNDQDKTYRFTLVYLEGRATLQDLERMFKK